MNVMTRPTTPATASLAFDTAKLDGLMQEYGLDAVLITSRHNVQYLLGGYRFFFFDVMEAIGTSRYLPVFVYQRGRPDNALYLGNKMEGFGRELGHIRAPQVKTMTWGTDDAMRSAAQYLRDLGIKRIGIEPSFLPAEARDTLVRELPHAQFANAQRALERLRAVKTPAELADIRAASEKVTAAMQATFKASQPGMTKLDVVDRLRREEQERGLVFEYCLITAGLSHNRAPSNQVIQAGDIISLDSGGNYHGYIGDLTRMGIVGEPDAELHDLLGEVEVIQQAARAAIKPGALGRDIMQVGEAALRSSAHRDVSEFTAHGIGLVSHEAPRLTASGPVPYPPDDAECPLQPGMVVSIETAILHPRRGYIKLEDTLIVTQEGWEAPGEDPRGWTSCMS